MSQDPLFTEDELEAARVLFARQASFLMGAVSIDGLPPGDLPEVAFAGRSNVGKSSLINALVGHKGLARASNEPGRTRELNFFMLDERLRLVDLPGYGWAKASKTTVKKFQDLGRDYLRGRNFSTDTIAKYRVGYHPDNWDWLSDRARGRFSAETLQAARLIQTRDNGSGNYDLFVDRVLFPIHDERGRTVAFGGRRQLS